jgi:DnaJ-class molecular chaperone
VEIDVPSELTQEQRRLLKEFSKASGEYSGPLSKSFLEKMKRMFK